MPIDPATGLAIADTAFRIGGSLFGGNEENIGWGDTRPQWAVPWMRDRLPDINALGAPLYYPGQTVADLNPSIMRGLTGINLWGQPGYGGERGRQQSLTAAGRGLGALGHGMNFVKGLAAQGPAQFGYDQGTFNQTMGNLMPGLQDAYAAATRDLTRDLNWNTLPGLNMQNAMSGQMGGSKLGQQSALAQGMASDRAADIGSSLWMNAANQANQAALMAGRENLGAQQQFGQDIMRGYGQFGALGLPFISTAYDMGLQNRMLPLQVGEYMRGYDQQLIDADVARWNYDQNRPWETLSNKINMANALIGQPVTPYTTGANWLQAGSQAAGFGRGLYSNLSDIFGWGKPTGGDNSQVINDIISGDFQW